MSTKGGEILQRNATFFHFFVLKIEIPLWERISDGVKNYDFDLKRYFSDHKALYNCRKRSRWR